MTSPTYVTQSFWMDQKVPARSTMSIDVVVNAPMTVERVVVPSAWIGRFRLHSIMCGIWLVADAPDLERYVTLEGPSLFGEFDAMPGQNVRLMLENLTDEEQSLDGAFIRGRALEAHLVLSSQLERLRDRGRQLADSSEADSSTARAYAKGWNAALEVFEKAIGVVRHPEQIAPEYRSPYGRR